MRKKVLIIDDSALMRRILSDIITLDHNFQVYATAANGQEGLEIMEEEADNIDVVLLDLNMPIMNGIEFLKELNKKEIDANVVIVSTAAKSDERETILALELGAFDFVTKPETYSNIKSKEFSKWLLGTVALATTSKKIPREKTPVAKIETQKVVKRKDHGRKVLGGLNKVVAIACSTGGPKALHNILSYLPQNIDAPLLIVQHMPAGFTKSLAERLDDVSKLYVKEAEHGDILKKGSAYIAKGGCQMRVVDGEDGQVSLALTEEPPRNSLRPCADIMYESIMDTQIEKVICVVLTGMGRDGTKGISQLSKTKETYVIAQDEKSSIVYGMPRGVMEANLVDQEVDLKDVANAIVKHVGVL